MLDWTIPVVLLVGLSLMFWTTDLDLSLAARFYTPGGGWEHGGEQPWKALYDYGVVPAWILALSALGVFIASFRMDRARPHRRAALFLVLAMIVGPGLVVNNVFKQNWGRPRPLDVTQLGGDRPYVAPLVKRPSGNGNSFTSGHAATGFYLLTPFFLLRRRHRWRAMSWLLLGLVFGSLVGLARMIQGAHFASDVLWSLGIVYLTGLALVSALRPASDQAST